VGEKVARLDVDFRDPEVVGDPFGVYEEVRAAGRVVWNEAAGGWMIPGYEDCLEVLIDTQGSRFGSFGGAHPERTFWFDAPNMITVDGAEHRRLRQGIARHFTLTATTRRWKPRISAVVEEVLAPLADEGASMDLVGDFAKIAVVVVAEMLGVPEERHEALRRCSVDVVSKLEFGGERPEDREAIDAASAELNGYITEEIQRHREEDLDDLLTVMLSMPDWSEAEIRSSAINLLLAGYDLAAKLLAACLVVLEQHPGQRRKVVENLAMVPNAVEEVLRWHGSSQTMVRTVVHDTVLGGTSMRAGDRVYLLVGAANRDPSQWPRPDRFDVAREFRPHLGFGAGPHLCISAPLARLETEVALEAVLRVAPEYRLRDVVYGGTFFVRGPAGGVIQRAG
jgi:cytochrome P450